MNKKNTKYNKELVVHDQLEQEIQRHKWIESQKAGRDIGHFAAEQDWLCNHFPSWKTAEWEKALKTLETQEKKKLSKVIKKAPQKV